MPIPIHDDSTDANFADGIAAGTSSVREFPPLEHFRVQNIPPAAYYIPDFITKEEEEYLLRKVVDESPQPKWKKVGTGRRLQYWGGTMSKNGILLPEPLPDFLTSFPDIIYRIESFLKTGSVKGKEKMELGIVQVLVNEYLPGQGISPHEDGPAFQPLVATLSLGSHTVLDLHHYLNPTKPSPPMISHSEDQGGKTIAAIPLAHLLLMPRSLLVLRSSLYTSHLHSIAAKEEDLIVHRPITLSGNASLNGDEGDVNGGGVEIANMDLLGDAEIVDSLKNTGRWKGRRDTRVSLTFRKAEKVLKGGALGAMANALKR